VAITAGGLLFFVPFLYVKFKRGQRLAKFEEQFPEAIDLISRALRAGHAFTTGLAMAAEEIPAPVGQEFKLLYDRQNFGMPLPDALKAFAARIPLIDARFFATAVLTQRETGGNLGEVLDNLASVIRERFKVKRQVRVLTAHGRITGWILAGLPPALAAAMFVMAPGHMDLLTQDPLGVQMIIGALVLQVTGTMIIRKLVNIRY
jgi:tight adherence protein B